MQTQPLTDISMMMIELEKQREILERQRQARKRYYERNKAKLNEQTKMYRKERYANDPNYRELLKNITYKCRAKKIQSEQQVNNNELIAC